MSTQSVLEYASRKIGGVPRLPPVVGGSGRRYWTIAAALAGEASFAITVAGVVPQAGTQAGVVVFQAGQSAVNNFYQSRYVLNTDTTPSNGLVSQFAQISDYVGATRSATINKPLNFVAESTVAIIQPAKIALEEDMTEDVSVTIPLEIDLQGHKITGKIDVTAGNFLWIRGGSGYVTNGIQKTDFGLLKVDQAVVSLRNATIYSILLTNGSNLGRCELTDCELNGRVSGRRGYSGWLIKNCNGLGAPSTSGFANLPFTLVESVAGVAITLVALDAELDTEFGGAVLYSENSLTGATAYISILGGIRASVSYMEQEPTPRNFSLCRAAGAGILTVTQTTGYKNLTFRDFVWTGNNSTQQPMASYLSAESLTGSLTFTDNVGANLPMADCQIWNNVLIEGSSATSATVTLAGSGVLFFPTVDPTFRFVTLAASLTGSVVHSIAFVNVAGGDISMISYDAAQTSGTPTVTISTPTVQHLNGTGFRVVRITANVSVGTYTYSCNFQGGHLSQIYDGIFALTAGVSAGTWNFSGRLGLEYADATQQAVLFIKSAGSGGTVTFSGNMTVFRPSSSANSNNFIFVSHGGSGGSLIVSGTLLMKGIGCLAAGVLASATVSGGTASVTGDVTISDFLFQGSFTICNPNAAGTTVNGPSSISFNHCAFLSTFNSSSGGGTLTWAGSSLTFRHCHVDGLFSFTGTNFTTVHAYHSRFNGNSSNNSVTGGGSRPTTYRYWKCSFAAIVSGLTPEIIEDYAVVPASAALTRGNLTSINSSAQVIAALTSSVVEGVLLAAAAGAGSPAILVRRGKVFVSSDSTVVAGDSCVLDAVTTPTNQIKGAAVVGQRIGRALEAVGATIANLAWTEVNLM
jgi:hypothetical protein